MPSTIAVRFLGSTDDDERSARRHAWGEAYRTVSPGRGKGARDAEDEGVPAVPGQTIARWWSRWRSWLKPPRGLSPETRPLDLGFVAWVYHLKNVAQRLSHHHLRHGSRDQQTPLWSPHYQTHGCRADRSLDQTECRNGRCAASQASRAVSSMRALRPMCTTGRRPVHRSRAKVSELTPNHCCASSRGIRCGGTGISHIPSDLVVERGRRSLKAS
jgi:hypothetical protein